MKSVHEIKETETLPVWKAFKIFFDANMVEIRDDSEFFLVGERLNDYEELESHAIVFIHIERLDKQKKKVTVVTHLDCNFDRPSCTHPTLLGVASDSSSWRKKFFNYKQIQIFILQGDYSFIKAKHAKRI